MHIHLTKLTNDRHRLEIVRADGSREAVELATRSYLLHDLLHLAVESEARLQSGFWGWLARGKAMAEMNDRTGLSLGAAAGEILVVEQVVGVLTAATKGAAPDEVLAALARWTEAAGRTLPGWLDEPFVERVQARLRGFLGHWRATPFGQTMTVEWAPQ